MAEIRTSHLFTLKLAVNGMQAIGETPAGNRRVGLVAGGTFEGPKLRGTVLPSGTDWIIGRPDGVTTLDVRLVLETEDKATILSWIDHFRLLTSWSSIQTFYHAAIRRTSGTARNANTLDRLAPRLASRAP